MKKNIFKQCVCTALAAAMALSFTACGKAEIPMASKENVYTTTEIPMPEAFDYIQSMDSAGDKIYIIGTKSNVDETDPENPIYTSETMLSIIDSAGNKLNTVSIAKDDGTGGVSKNVNRMCVSEDGTVTLLINEYSWNEETYESTNKFYTETYDQNGTLAATADLSSLKTEDNEDFYIGDMTIDNSGNVYLSGNNCIYVASSDGKLSFSIKGDEQQGDSGSYINAVRKTADGRVVAIVNSYSYDDENYTSTNTAKVIDMNTKGYTDEYPLSNRYYQFYNGGGEYDLYVSTDNTLSGVDLETGSITTVIDWLKSGFDTTTMDRATVLSDGRILCTSYKYDTEGEGYSWSGSDMILTILSKVDPSEVPDKELITVYAYYLDYQVKQRIVEFNKSSDKYQIEVTTYYDYDDGTGSYDAGLTKFNNDLISGNIPDIILLDNSMAVDSYISKGILADLYTYIDKDESINREDYLPNVLDAFSVNGKLYQIAPSFTINTVVGKSSVVGTKEGWTMADYLALAQANPDKEMFAEMTKEGFLSTALGYCLNSYVNPETGECYFNGDGFKGLLEAANAYPQEIDYDSLYADESYWTERESAYRDGKTLLNSAYLFSFQNIREIEQGQFGEPITFVGFPCDNGNGACIITNTANMAITSKAKNPDGAWEFVRYFLTDEYQNTITGSFPLKTSAYPALMEKAKEKPYYMDGDEKVEYDNTYWIGDTQINIGVNTDADNERIMNYIKSVTSVANYDQSLMNIINEEAGAYFSGQKSIDEVAEIIQNRASTYISENR